MPELPEVETIVRGLRNGDHERKLLVGCTFTDVKLFWERTLASPVPQEFVERIIGQTIVDICRRGKYIIFHLTEEKLLIHLRMSGDLRVETIFDEHGVVRPDGRHDRVVFYFEDDLRLVFVDPRKFGRVWLTKMPEKILGKLGPEPLSPGLTCETFFDLLKTRRRQLKPLLMDQTFLAGLGNIYTDEALHLAKLHPLQKADKLTLEDVCRLLNAIRSVLREGIQKNGASIDWVYKGGSYQNTFRVYQRTEEPCLECGQSIKKIIVGQRGTHFCPGCQPFFS
ncbi:MAG: bifunctional DNA-formamidopyrimidine glycosylase/DNA-(apurinic or apyrimidinic site) lyase [Anaerolineaceae bacterium]|nr:bifunctional DNA-formamidopyrimidine glycosylase/DNA-(apurinic or apyrimidinic site) lyase [Anaerolineaceae bacterium]